MTKLRFKVHAIIQMDERGLSVADVRMALENGEDIESELTSPLPSSLGARPVQAWCPPCRRS
jgi:hypothetical protein